MSDVSDLQPEDVDFVLEDADPVKIAINPPIVHFNDTAPLVSVCDAYDTACGVSSFMLDRWVTRTWTRVTCQRCLRHKARVEQ